MTVRTADGQGWAVPPNKGRTFPPEVLTQGEIRALLAACGRSATGLRNRALLVVLWRAGLRVGEALALRPSDLDPAAGTLRVPRGKTGHRTVGLDPEALALVEQWMTHRSAVLRLNGRRPLFCTLRGQALQSSYVRSSLVVAPQPETPRRGVAARFDALRFRPVGPHSRRTAGRNRRPL